MNSTIQLAIERGQKLTTAEMFMNAGIVILVVFAVLLLMYILISLSGKIIQAITSIGKKAEPAKAAPAARWRMWKTHEVLPAVWECPFMLLTSRRIFVKKLSKSLSGVTNAV